MFIASKSYDIKVVAQFLKNWSPAAVDPKTTNDRMLKSVIIME